MVLGLLACTETPISESERKLSIEKGLSDSSLPVEQRVYLILDNMSLEQKVAQMMQAEIRSVTPADIERYGLGSILNGGGAFPYNKKHATLSEWRDLSDEFYEASITKSNTNAGIPIIWGTDAVHGHNNVIGATLFPHNIGLGAANDPELIRKIGAATAQEVVLTGIDWVFAPAVAVVKDNRWGRTYEGYSDQPVIVDEYARQMVLGMQGEGENFLAGDKVIATAKHFIGDGGTYRGIDQGDTVMTLDDLVTEHGIGYVSAIDANVQTVMASFNSWNGEKIHGRKDLLTNILRGQMGFDGFVISDWNGHGQIDGCNNKSCAQAINAGVDMVMVPEDWKQLIANTISQVKSGEITEQRIDEAVSRILRVKIRSGLFEAGAPSTRVSKEDDVLVGSNEHREIAREAVRKSLVLLKNDGQLLPLNPNQKVLVAGDGADNIGKQSGGWTLSWQGRGNMNEDFPGGTSIYDGVKSSVEAAGGMVSLNVDGSYLEKPDVAIVVFGEEPYAEGQGDVETLQYQVGIKSDLALLQKLKSKGIPVVSVFLTGRPLWVNAEINASDAFVVAWLPGSEGSGVADVIMSSSKGEIAYDFTGKLSYDWPAVEVNSEDYSLSVETNLFDYGYGLTYQDRVQLDFDLSEIPVNETSSLDLILFSGSTRAPYKSYLGDESNWGTPVVSSITTSAYGEAAVRTVDRMVQEDSIQVEWAGSGAHQSQFYLQSEKSVDLSGLRGLNGALSMLVRVDSYPEGQVIQRMDCGYPCNGEIDLTEFFNSVTEGQWLRLSVPLSCFEEAGANLTSINTPFLVTTDESLSLTFNEISILAEVPKGSLISCSN